MSMDERLWYKDPHRALKIATMVLVAIAMLGLLNRTSMSASPSHEEDVAAKGAQVMPFDLDQTMHHFQALEDGGLQTVTVKDPSNSTQMALIQAHLQEEAEKFRQGDFSDPATIHGGHMPGLAALQTGARPDPL